MYCANCGALNDDRARFCKVCGKIGGFVETPGAAAGLALPRAGQQPGTRPWYFSRPFLIAAFLLVPPLWVALVLIAPDIRRTAKVAGAVVGGIYLVGIALAALILLDRDDDSLAAWFGLQPDRSGTVQFGTDLRATGSDVTVVNPKASFGRGDVLSYVAYLRQPAGYNATRVVVTKVVPGLSDELIDSRLVTVSDPTSSRIWGKLTVDEGSVMRYVIPHGPGTYRIRFTQNNVALAEGQFNYLGP
jgi:hypothetical protein